MKKIFEFLNKHQIPGFRTRYKWKSTLAIIGYSLIVLFSLIMWGGHGLLSGLIWACVLIGLVFIFSNYRGILSFIPNLISKNKNTKISPYVALVIFSLIIIGGIAMCHSTETVTPKDSNNTEQAKSDKEIQKENEKADEEAQEEAKKQKEKKEKEYKQQILDNSTKIVDSIGYIIIFIANNKNEQYWTNKEKMTFSEYLADIKSCHTSAEKMDVPEKFKETHKIYLKGTKKYSDAMELIRQAFNEGVTYKADQANKLMSEGQEYMFQAMDKMFY